MREIDTLHLICNLNINRQQTLIFFFFAFYLRSFFVLPIYLYMRFLDACYFSVYLVLENKSLMSDTFVVSPVLFKSFRVSMESFSLKKKMLFI